MSGVGRGLVLPDSPPLPPSSSTRSGSANASTTASPRLKRSSTITAASTTTNNKGAGSYAANRRLREASHATTTSIASLESSTSTSTLDVALLPLVPLPQHLAPYLSSSSSLTSTEKRTLFTSCYLRASSANNLDTLEWLLSIPSDPTLSHAENAANHRRRFSATGSVALEQLGSDLTVDEEVHNLPNHAPRKWVDLEATDEEGNTALVLASALGHSEGVRILVEGGALVSKGDRAGWTPLHWAVQNNDLPIAAYLLNHKASANVASLKSLTPRDLVKRGEEGSPMRDILDSADAIALERERSEELSDLEEDGTEGSDDGRGEGRRRPGSVASFASTSTRGAWAGQEDKVEEERKELEGKRRMELAAETAAYLELDVGLLGVKRPNVDERSTQLRTHQLEEESEEDEEAPPPFEWQRCLPDQMLVFALDELPILFDVVISHYKPVRRRAQRIVPANVLFLCARFAHHFGTPEMLEELLVGAMERIEAAVHDRPDDMTVSAFWLSNCLLLLYYLRKEPHLNGSTRDLRLHLADLINEVFVFILRDAERRIDKVLEQAMLEHEGLPGFEDVDFEDEWRFVKKLTGKRAKRVAMPKSPSARSIFGGSDVGNSPPRLVKGSTTSIATVVPEEASPATVTALLSSTLFVLQAYEIPPSIIVQAFSQLFYWIACEVFNRLLTQKKYLCRSRAMQVRLNASALEEWARTNRLPLKMVSIHLAPLNQLLQWLQCLSSENSVDGLIGTIQSLRALNPAQLLKAAKDYRYEVDEGKMEADCVEYLRQIEKQWERVRVQLTTEEVGAAADAKAAGPLPVPVKFKEDEEEKGLVSEEDDSGSSPEIDRNKTPPPPPPPAKTNGHEPVSPSSPGDEALEKVIRMIDDVFSDPSSFGTYVPPGGSEALGELLNSRYMLPFAVPSSAEMLLRFDTRDAFGPFSTPPTSRANSVIDGLRSPSRASTTSNVTAPTTPGVETDSMTSKPAFVPVLPDDFFETLDAAKRRNWVGRNAHNGEGGQWSNWRANMPLSDDEDDEDEEAEEEGDDSVECEATPRAPTIGTF